MSSQDEEFQSWFDNVTAKSGFDPKPEQVCKKVFIAPAHVQKVWHERILNTQQYWRECLASPAGRYIHCLWDEQDALMCRAEPSVGPGDFSKLQKGNMSPSEFFAFEGRQPWMRRTLMSTKCIGRTMLVEEYARLMELLLDPITRIAVVPPPILDALWHDHILYSCSYFAFCAATNKGKYLHHVTAAAKLPLQPTLRAYALRFGHEAPLSLWGCLSDSSSVERESGSEHWINANSFLCTTDHVHPDMPLDKFAGMEVDEISCGNYFPSVHAMAAVRRTCRRCRSFVSELAPAFSAEFCNEIKEAATRLQSDVVETRYSGRRRYSRLLTRCPAVSSALWRTVRPAIEQLLSTQPSHRCPLGFGTAQAGEWRVVGLNPVLRINTYRQGDHIGLHLDSQFCPTSDRRSLLTLLVYLTSAGPRDASVCDFSGGESRFYVPKAHGQTPSTVEGGVTVAEWVRSAGGLRSGWDAITVTPERGAAVVMTQDLLHEGAPVLSGTKVVLRTDVMVERAPDPATSALHPAEIADYNAAMSCFREAQRLELSQCHAEANDWYERALTLRYRYPTPAMEARFDTCHVNDRGSLFWCA